MLSNRNDRTHSGQKLSVGVAYPKRYVLSRLVRRLTLGGALLGAAAGFGHAVFVSSQHGDLTTPHLILETLLGAGFGATAGLAGSLAYAFIGGAGGTAAGLLGAGLIGAGSFAAFPSIAAMPRALTPAETGVTELGPLSTGTGMAQISSDPLSTSTELGYIEPGKTGNAYVPVLDDDTIKEEAPPEAPIYRGPFNDRVLYLGMNIDATRSATRQMSRNASVSVITDDGPQDRVRNGNKLYDLRSKNGINAFAQSLGVNKTAQVGVVRAMNMCEKEAKDELGELAKVWAAGEKGAKIPSRLVLAGHSNGDGVWGDNNGSLRLGPLLELSRALPHATAQIEDAFVTGCYGGGEVTMDQYLLIFPRAKTIWAYDAQAPGVDNGAKLDQGGWEKATRGRAYNFEDSKSASLGKTMAVWNYKTGYHAATPPLNVDDLRGKVQWMEEHFYQLAFKGQDYTYDSDGFKIPIRITDPHTGPVRQYYSWLVRLTQHKELPEDERAFWNEKKNQAIRLLYFSDTVTPAFARHFGKQLATGYAKMGLKVPNLARMSRAAALKEINGFNAKLQKNPNAPSDSQQVGVLLERGLKELDPSLIPDGWV